ncbi:MAG: hypothetical protein AUJ52_14680 [Elusimicrobia bacterium CG1_02_63_36]|nr:MAG: hypothetical protein AUJ52_14680 [Elusimicrobia bacterium CG1_02_63_36]PIP82841.1 MAG: hypothetical protein COR54_12785 [Elusimicrobia bacterium CG22_combo_CG10-13_8_21_14_all_63_91]PJA18184.1 MAG: hypothetical protein COX66_02115 [Elusimicrobia bacterium CG_4_10_14_0_2_um_filter_63_34]PJB25129.1 MAG: hypothetical protein CO113_10325 [Elusimicrobia bacterium CG_4_9_14_3_um_filter_62_55]
MGKPLKVALVGLRYDEFYAHTLAVGYMKCFSDADPRLKGRVESRIVERTVHEPIESQLREILEDSPDVVGFSCYLWNMVRVEQLVAMIKEARPEVRVVLGGPEVSVRAEGVLREIPGAEAVVRGEGELTYAEILARWLDGESLEGCLGASFRRNGEPVSMEDRPLMPDLSIIPSPFLQGVFTIKPGERIALETSRGCPLQCRFCDWQNFQTTRWFPAERVIEEVSTMRRQATGIYYFVTDADINTNKKRALEVLSAWDRITGAESVHWHLQTYLANIDEDLSKVLNSYKFSLGAGIETIQPAALKRMVRGFSRRGVERSIGYLKKNAPQVGIHLQLIHALPGDDLWHYKRSLEWALSMNSDSLFLPRALALPGAEFGKYPEQYGILDVMPEAPYRVLETESFSREEIDTVDDLAFRILNTHKVGALRRVLEMVGPRERPEKPAEAETTPWVDLLERFFDHMERKPGFYRMARQWYLENDALGKIMDQEPMVWDQQTPEDRLAAHAELAAFAEAELESLGRGGEWYALRYFLTTIEARVLWEKVLQTRAFNGIFDRLLGGESRESRRLRWFGWEGLAPERGLCHRGRHLHIVSTLMYDTFEVCDMQRALHVHLEETENEERWNLLFPEDQRPFDATFLSNVYWAIPPKMRVAVFRRLRERNSEGAGRLVLWFDDVGISDFEFIRRTGAEGQTGRPDWSETIPRLAAELKEAGWRIDAEPATLAADGPIGGKVRWALLQAVPAEAGVRSAGGAAAKTARRREVD